MAVKPLRYEIRGVMGEGIWFRLYECEHITEGSYPIAKTFPIGSHANIVLCKHCWEGIKGEIAKDLIAQIVMKGIMSVEEVQTLASPLEDVDALANNVTP